ncbi:MAG: vWA domain-containing protein [Polyangiaceae bacterium]
MARRHPSPWSFLAALPLLAAACGSQQQDQLGIIDPPNPGSGGEGSTGACTDCNEKGGPEGSGYTEEESTGNASQAAPTANGLADGCADMSSLARRVETNLSGDKSFASPALTRALLSQDIAPLPAHVRTQDFLNYYPPDFAKPVGTSAPSGVSDVPELMVELAPHSKASKLDPAAQYDLLVAVRAPVLPPPSAPEVMVVLDTTPSVGEAGLERGKHAASTLIGKLPADAKIVLKTSDPALDARANGLEEREQLLADLTQVSLLGGERSFSETLEAATAEADQHARVFLVTDGEDDPTQLDASALAARTEKGMVVHSIAIGAPLAHGDRYFRALAWVGRGYYLYVDSDQEAESLLTAHLPGMLSSALQDVRVELLLPWYFKVVRDGSEQSLDFTQTKPQNIGPGATATYLFRLEVCDGNLPYTTPDVVKVALRYNADNGESVALPADLSLDALLAPNANPQLPRTLAIRDYAEALKTLDSQRLAEAKQRLDQVGATFPDPALTQLSSLLEHHPLLGQ